MADIPKQPGKLPRDIGAPSGRQRRFTLHALLNALWASSDPQSAPIRTIVAPAPDGKVRYSAHWNGTLGILDPITGHTREVKLGTV